LLMFLWWFGVFVGLFFSLSAVAGLTIPKGLDRNDRDVVTRTLGLTTGSKLLTNPYPLGGYSGLEVGISMEFIDTEALNRLGCEPGSAGCANEERPSNQELSYPRITVGKGLYHDIDVFMHFVPPFQDLNLSDFGLQVRWSFFQAKFLPLSVAVNAHANQINVDNKFISQNFGALVTAGVNVNDFSIYFGNGFISAESQFTCGDTGDGTIDSANDCNESNILENRQYGTHSLVGLSIEFFDMFAAAQIDRYRDPVFSAKLGIRF
jgi:hypothetical protein